MIDRLFAVTVALVLLAGCGSSSDDGGGAKHEGDSLTIVAPTTAWTIVADPYASGAESPAKDLQGTVLSVVVSDKNAADWGVKPSTTTLVSLSGLKPSTGFMAHVHLLACADTLGGGHYQNVPGGPADATNEIWFNLMSDSEGVASAKTEVPWAVRAGEAKSVVVHDMTKNAEGKLPKLACEDLAF